MDYQLSDKVRERIRDILPETTELRRRLHAHPELKFEEFGTMGLIRSFLSGGKIELLDPMIGTDTVGLLKGEKTGPTILLRADMDALPLTETSGQPWSSKFPGKAHACGHDGHMAMLLAAAKVLEQSVDELSGNIRFVFEPAEEEIGGGKALVAKGLLELEPRPDLAFALHGWSGIPRGVVSCAHGAAMAASDNFVVRITGRGGHGGMPHLAADPVISGIQAMYALQTIVSRAVDPLDPVVISVCKISAGNSRNVIPSELVFEGTVRYFKRELRDFIREKMDAAIAGACAAGGCAYVFDFIEGYIPLQNDKTAVLKAKSIVSAALGGEVWVDDQPPSMGSEDFAYYLQDIPGCLLRLGQGECWPSLHHPSFDFNDETLERGVSLLVALSLGYKDA